MIDRTRSDAPPEWALRYDARPFAQWSMTVDVVGLAVDVPAQDLEALLVTRGQPPFESREAWPGGFVHGENDPDAMHAALRELKEETGQTHPQHIEELHAYDAWGRDPRQFAGHPDPRTKAWVPTGTRIVSKAFLALFRKAGRKPATTPGSDASSAHWTSVYAFLPWEDLRTPASRATLARLTRDLRGWARAAGRKHHDARLERIRALFDVDGWNEEQADERWRLVLEAGLAEEALRDRWGLAPRKPATALYGQALAFDHRTMLADGLATLRRMIKYSPRVVKALVDQDFRLSELQLAFEAIGGRPLYRANFRRALTAASWAVVMPTGQKLHTPGPGKPADLYRVRDDRVDYRLDPPLNLPWAPEPES